jgi:hypothetical protein
VWVAGAWRGETPLSLELPDGPTLIWLVHPEARTRALVAQASAGAAVTAKLEPVEAAERLRPLVDAVRQTAGGARREAALALAGAIGVDALVVVEPGSEPEVYGRRPPPPPAASAPPPLLAAPTLRAVSPPRQRPWYKKPWPWVLIVGGAAVAATAVAVGVTLGTSTVGTITCCR